MTRKLISVDTTMALNGFHIFSIDTKIDIKNSLTIGVSNLTMIFVHLICTIPVDILFINYVILENHKILVCLNKNGEWRLTRK